MKERILNIASFLVGFAVGISLCAFAPQNHPQIPEPTSANTSVETTFETNRAGNAHQLDWFKDNSNYIWDGWKIK